MVMEPSWQWSSIRLFLRNGTCATSEFRCKLHGIGEFLGRCSSHISRFQGVGFLEKSHGSLGPKTWKKGIKLNISEWKSKRNIQNSLGSCVEICVLLKAQASQKGQCLLIHPWKFRWTVPCFWKNVVALASPTVIWSWLGLKPIMHTAWNQLLRHFVLMIQPWCPMISQ